ncbi:MAG: hypothetical protein JWM11_1140, partial [Planctomycetaceae bacterium]|nr:hypothetical protein [Planctomycetaceae bacterium]
MVELEMKLWCMRTVAYAARVCVFVLHFF